MGPEDPSFQCRRLSLTATNEKGGSVLSATRLVPFAFLPGNLRSSTPDLAWPSRRLAIRTYGLNTLHASTSSSSRTNTLLSPLSTASRMPS